MRVHPRTVLVQQADAEFGFRLSKEVNKIEPSVNLDEYIFIMADTLANIGDLDAILVTNEVQKVIIDNLNKVSQEHELTISEKIGLLLGAMQRENKYFLRWERHGNYEKEADIE
jgi:hypothetical protein